MNVPKSSITKIPIKSIKLKKSSNYRTHMLNFNKQHFDVWGQETFKGLKVSSTHKALSPAPFIFLLVVTILLYVLTIFFYESISSVLYYDVWVDISKLLDQSGYWQAQQSSSKYSFFYNLDGIKNNTQTFTSLKETFSKIKILSSITN